MGLGTGKGDPLSPYGLCWGGVGSCLCGGLGVQVRLGGRAEKSTVDVECRGSLGEGPLEV